MKRSRGPDTRLEGGIVVPNETAAEFTARWYELAPGFCTTVTPDVPGRICFSGALFAVKVGFKIQRARWEHDGQYVVRQAGYPDGIPINGNTATAIGATQGEMCAFAPYLTICLGQVSADHPPMFVPWTPTMIDVLAADWQVLDK